MGVFSTPLKSIAKRNSCHELSIRWFPSLESLLPFIFHYSKILAGSIFITSNIPACLYGHTAYRCLGDRLLSAQRQGILIYRFHFTAPNCGAAAQAASDLLSLQDSATQRVLTGHITCHVKEPFVSIQAFWNKTNYDIFPLISVNFFP